LGETFSSEKVSPKVFHFTHSKCDIKFLDKILTETYDYVECFRHSLVSNSKMENAKWN